MLDGRTLELLQVHPVDAGGGSIFRPDLRDELRHLAEEGDGLGPPCRLVGQTAVACFDPEQGIVQFDDGSQESADLIIAADGVHSSASKYLNSFIFFSLLCLRRVPKGGGGLFNAPRMNLNFRHRGTRNLFMPAPGRLAVVPS